MEDVRPKTIFLDIDGTLIYQYGGLDQQIFHETVRLPYVLERLHEWDLKGYIIILCTGRKESMRRFTEEQLLNMGIYYDQLIMGLGGGVRVLINNEKSSSPGMETAVGLTIPKNEGLGEVEI